MGVFVRDTMTGTNWTDLHLRTGELGATWTRHPDVNGGSSRWYLYGGRVHSGVWGTMYASGTPASADYDVTCTYRVYTTVSTLNLGICVRMSTTEDTYYSMYYQAGELVLIKRVDGVTSPALDYYIGSLTGGGTDYTFKLETIGTAIKGYVNGIERVSATDSSITAAGKAGLRSLASNDAATGNHIDNFVATDTSIAATGRSYSLGLIGL